MKKEYVYVNLQGKTKEELTDLWVFLKSNGEKPYRELEWFLYYGRESFEPIGFTSQYFCGLGGNESELTEVTIDQLKQIIKPMENKEEQLIEEAKRRGFLREGNRFYSCFDDKNKIRVIKPYNSNSKINLYLDFQGYLRYYYGLNNEYDNSLCSNPAIYKDGVWAEIVSDSLEQKLQKAEVEVKRLQSLIEKENKIKIGDWVYSTSSLCFYKKELTLYQLHERKITNPELIKLLNDEIK